MGLPAATVSTSVMEMERGGHLYKKSAMPAAPRDVREEEKEVMKVVRGGHLYKNSAIPAAAESLEIRESVKIGRGGHLYKNGAMPAVPMEVRNEE